MLGRDWEMSCANPTRRPNQRHTRAVRLTQREEWCVLITGIRILNGDSALSHMCLPKYLLTIVCGTDSTAHAGIIVIVYLPTIMAPLLCMVCIRHCSAGYCPVL